MRRWIVVIAMGSVLTLSACSLPAGVDGNMVDDWVAMSVPQPVVPVTGSCYPSRLSDMLVNVSSPCTETHLVQTVFVGTFTGAAASAPKPPEADSTGLRHAYATCVAPAKAYLGGDWHTGQLVMTVIAPDSAGWSGGQRWYRCDVSEISTPGGSGHIVESTQDLSGVLAGPKAQVLTCFDWDDHKKYIDNFRPATCAKKHSGEFAGIFTATDLPWLSSSKARATLAGKGCAGVVAKFLGFGSAASYFSDTVGYAWNDFDEDQWKLGDRSTRCYAAAFTRDKKFIGSVKGIRGATAKG